MPVGPDPPPELAAAQPVAKCHWASRTERAGACKRNAPVRKSCRLQATTRSEEPARCTIISAEQHQLDHRLFKVEMALLLEHRTSLRSSFRFQQSLCQQPLRTTGYLLTTFHCSIAASEPIQTQLTPSKLARVQGNAHAGRLPREATIYHISCQCRKARTPEAPTTVGH